MKKPVLSIATSLFLLLFVLMHCGIATLVGSFGGQEYIAARTCCCGDDVATCSCACTMKSAAEKTEDQASLCSLYAAGCTPSSSGVMTVGERELAVPIASLAFRAPIGKNFFLPLKDEFRSICTLDGIFRPPKVS